MRQSIPKDIFKKPFVITFYWDDRLDIDNHAYIGKMIVDALKGWVITDDNKRRFKGVSHWYHNERCIRVIVEEV